MRRLLRDDNNRWPLYILFIRWVKHERISGTNVFTDQSWLPHNIPYFPPQRHEYICDKSIEGVSITELFRYLFTGYRDGANPARTYCDFEHRIFTARKELRQFLFNSKDTYLLAMILRWVMNKEHLSRRISLKSRDNDPTFTMYKNVKVENHGDVVINPFTVSFEEWLEWAESRVIYDFVRGVEMQVVRRGCKREYLRRWMVCTWKPVCLDHISDEQLCAAIDRTIAIGMVRAAKLLKKAAIPGKLEIELPVRFELLYQVINKFRLLDVKTPFTKVFYPLISVFLGPGVLLGELNLFDYFGVRWQCPCFWTGSSLFRVDRTILW